MSKKTLLACASAAALITSIGFVQAQNADGTNPPIDAPLGSPWAADSERTVHGLNDAEGVRPAGDASMSPADDQAMSSDPAMSSHPAISSSNTETDPSWSNSANDAPVEANATAPVTNDTAPTTSTAPATTTGSTSSTDYNAMPPTAAGTPAAAAPSSDSNMTVTSAPETRVDLSPPSDPLYNLPNNGERAPRPDRN
jgi:hypothetical protein